MVILFSKTISRLYTHTDFVLSMKSRVSYTNFPLLLPDPTSVRPVSGHACYCEQRRHRLIKQEVLLIGQRVGRRTTIQC